MQILGVIKFLIWQGDIVHCSRLTGKRKLSSTVPIKLAISFDVLPTMLSITNKKKPDTLNLDGINLSPLLFQGETLPKRTVVWRYRGQKMVRKGPWKLMITESDTLLFDLEADLYECSSLALQKANKVNELLNEYNQ